MSFSEILKKVMPTEINASTVWTFRFMSIARGYQPDTIE